MRSEGTGIYLLGLVLVLHDVGGFVLAPFRPSRGQSRYCTTPTTCLSRGRVALSSSGRLDMMEAVHFRLGSIKLGSRTDDGARSIVMMRGRKQLPAVTSLHHHHDVTGDVMVTSTMPPSTANLAILALAVVGSGLIGDALRWPAAPILLCLLMIGLYLCIALGGAGPSWLFGIVDSSSPGGGSGDDITSLKEEEGKKGTTTIRTCRVCLSPFIEEHNHDRACRYHCGDWLGNESSKFHGTRSGGPNTGLALFWDCCGAEKHDAPGCAYARHKTYDD